MWIYVNHVSLHHSPNVTQSYPVIPSQPCQVGLKLLQHQIHSTDHMLWSHLVAMHSAANIEVSVLHCMNFHDAYFTAWQSYGNAAFFLLVFRKFSAYPWLWILQSDTLAPSFGRPTFSSRGIPFSSSSKGLKTLGATGTVCSWKSCRFQNLEMAFPCLPDELAEWAKRALAQVSSYSGNVFLDFQDGTYTRKIQFPTQCRVNAESSNVGSNW